MAHYAELDNYPANYGFVFTRPVNWDEGVMPEYEAEILSRESSRRNYLVVWEGRETMAAYKNGHRQWTKKLEG